MQSASGPNLFDSYVRVASTWDELVGDDGQVRPEFVEAAAWLSGLTTSDLVQHRRLADIALLNQGVTFSVYGDERGTEKVFPFCTIPRMISAPDWAALERGLVQRVRALELFLADMYGEQRIIKSGAVDAEMILGSKYYEPRLRGIRPPGDIRVHVSGIDMIRDPDGVFRVLEDNLRCPSGVSYVLENRIITKRVVPEMFRRVRVAPVEAYPAQLASALRACAPAGSDEPTCVVLTPGAYNSAYFEHSFLARTMGVELVEPLDLYVDDDMVFARTIDGPMRVHVIYRRIDEAYLDPEMFRPDSMLGVPGIMRAYAKGNVALASAPGNGLADDKGVYPMVPDIIRYYLGEDAILQQVPTYMCAREDDRKYVLEHLDQLVVKAVDEAGGYGMLMGPQASKAEIEEFRAKVVAEPRKYIAQPRVDLSASPTFIPDEQGGGTVEPRRVDLRPYVVNSPAGPWVLQGGLTRTALVRGSYVVNSSQGGGSKDTWILE